MSSYIKPGVYTRHIDYSLYSKVKLKDFVTTYNVGYNRIKYYKKLKAKWAVETGKQIQSIHEIDTTAELVEIMAKQMRENIDKEIMKGLYNAVSV